MSDSILFVFEGQIKEPQVFNSILNCFDLDSDTTIYTTYNTVIYQLFTEIDKDPYLDILELIRESNVENKSTLAGITRDKIAKIYLIFDFDGQDHRATIPKLEYMLNKFTEETEHGKLYINYPMLESIKDIALEDLCERRCSISANTNIGYKNLVAQSTAYPNYQNYTKDIWFRIFTHHLSKMNCLLNDIYTLPDYLVVSESTQLEIFDKQKEKYLCNNQIAVLNSIPIWFYQEFGSGKYQELLDFNNQTHSIT